MKKLLPLLLIIVSTYSYGQNITFSKQDKNVKHTYDNSILNAPFTLVFQPDFKNDQIQITNGSGETIQATFGTAPLNPHGGSNQPYQIEVRANEDDQSMLMIFPFEENCPVDGALTLEIKINGIAVTTIKYQYTPGKPTGPEDKSAYQPGYLYYDALALLSPDIEPVDKLKIFSAYDYYGGANNPYLNPFYDAIEEKVGAHNAPQALLGSIGGMDVTNFAAGLSRFLAERAKEELNEAFFKKMKEQLNAYPELKTVFPQTTQILNTIENYSYSSVLQVLKETFEMDIQNLPENLYRIKDLTSLNCTATGSKPCDKTGKCAEHPNRSGCETCKCEERLAKIEDFFKKLDGQWLVVGMFTVKEAFQSGNPANLISSIATSEALTAVKNTSKTNSAFDSYNVVSSIELMNFISQSLISKNESQVWINSSEFSALFKTKDAFEIYLGLLLALQDKSSKKIEFYNQDGKQIISFGDILRQTHTSKEKLQGLIKNTYTGFNAANLAVKNIISANSKLSEADPQAMYDYYKALTNSLRQLVSNSLVKEITQRDLSAEYLKIEQYLNPAVDIAYHISTKKYSSAIYDAVVLLNHIPGFEDKVGKSFIKYGTLISTVASAESSDEVKKAIEASVLPAGSSAIKRKSAWSISVNGYVGLYYGVAHSKTRDTLFNSSTNAFDTITSTSAYNTYGLYAPIGLSFNRGFKCGWGFTFSTQILDLGALVNFYATKGDKAALPTDFKVRLSDILSPGLQLGINLPKCPITIMGGIQYVPALNKLSQVSSSEALSPIAWRGQIGIVVDIPLYNLKVWEFKN